MPTSRKPRLAWSGKDLRTAAAPVTLRDDQTRSLATARGLCDNRLIHGDNLPVLHALAPEFAGQIRCIYLDPPYNTRSDPAQYDDGALHRAWLSALRDRLEAMAPLLREDGSLWLQLDDHEVHYAKVLLDEVWGRANFVTSVVWRRRASQANSARHLATVHDHILVYAKNLAHLRLGRVPLKEAYVKEAYRNPDGDPRGPWRLKPLLQGKKSTNLPWTLTAPDGQQWTQRWRCSPSTFDRYLQDQRIHFAPGGLPNIKLFLKESKGMVPGTFWDGPGSNEEASREVEGLFGAKTAFDTPKPEALLAQILKIATDPEDWVLDAFAGSGTTGAVAHKLGRHWLMIEREQPSARLAAQRMRKVVEGADPGGATRAESWQGGGGFRYQESMPERA